MVKQKTCPQCDCVLEDASIDAECPSCLLEACLGDPANTTEVNDEIGPYRIVAPIGKGGMGVVYKAEDLRLGRLVAIKFLPPRLRDDPELYARFNREARALSKTNSPYLCVVHDVGESERGPYLVMEYIRGQTLRTRLNAGAILPAEFLDLSLQLARGINAAHEAGVIHRDIKPSNIIISEDGIAKIVDFGLVKFQAIPQGPTGSLEETQDVASAKQALATQHDQLLGTVPYMSPEQAAGQKIDFRSDLFSLGTVFYEMLTGIRPFVGPTTILTIHAILTGDFQPVHKLDDSIPLSLSDTVGKLLSHEADGRFSNGNSLIAHLESLRQDLVGTQKHHLASTAASAPAAAKLRAKWKKHLKLTAMTAAVTLALTMVGVTLTAIALSFWKNDHQTTKNTNSSNLSRESAKDVGIKSDELDSSMHGSQTAGKPSQKRPDLPTNGHGDLLTPEFVRGLVIEPEPYLDQNDSQRLDPAASRFIANLQNSLASVYDRHVKIVPVSREKWLQSKSEFKSSENFRIGSNLPAFGANLLLMVPAKFLPDRQLYVVELMVLNLDGLVLFRRNYLFSKQEFLENPEVCQRKILEQPIVGPKRYERPLMNPELVDRTIVEPVLLTTNPSSRFEHVTARFRNTLKQQLEDLIKPNTSVISVTREEWLKSLEMSKGNVVGRNIQQLGAEFMFYISGRYHSDYHVYEIRLSLVKHTGEQLFVKRFIYGQRDFEEYPEACQTDILNTTIFKSVDDRQ